MTGEHSPTTGARQAVVALQQAIAQSLLEESEETDDMASFFVNAADRIIAEYLEPLEERADEAETILLQQCSNLIAKNKAISALEALLVECGTFIDLVAIIEIEGLSNDARALLAKLKARAS